MGLRNIFKAIGRDRSRSRSRSRANTIEGCMDSMMNKALDKTLNKALDKALDKYLAIENGEIVYKPGADRDVCFFKKHYRHPLAENAYTIYWRHTHCTYMYEMVIPNSV